MQTMCFRKADKLNEGHRSKTYLKVAKATPSSTKLGLAPPTVHHLSKTSLTSSKLVVGSQARQPSTGSTSRAGGGTAKESADVAGCVVSGISEESQKDYSPNVSGWPQKLLLFFLYHSNVALLELY